MNDISLEIMKTSIINTVRKFCVFFKGLNQISKEREHQVQFYNMWENFNRDDAYWFQFLSSRGLLKKGNTIAFFSCFGPRYLIDMVNTNVKIFFTGESLKRSNTIDYCDHALKKISIDLAIGFEVFEDARYVRFPLWMDYMFPAESTEEDIREKCKQLRFPQINKDRKFCCMVATNSADGLRQQMMDAIAHIGHVDSGGKYLHNDDSLQKEYGDNKQAYLKSYVFNICPENSSAYGYTTEKLFEAISSGCIPIYWGAEFADKAVINEDAIIQWSRKDNGEEAISKITELWSNPKLLEDFLSQPRILPTAEEYILDTFSTVESRMRRIINNA